MRQPSNKDLQIRRLTEAIGEAHREIMELRREILSLRDRVLATVPIRLRCEVCHELHIDEGEFATKPHHTHACQACGAVWRPAVVNTVGVRFLPGFKNDP